MDQILSLVVKQGADELRLVSDAAPVVLAAGVKQRVTLAPTPESVLRQLLGELLSAARLGELDGTGRVAFEHEPTGLGRFRVTLVKQPGGLQATFERSTRAARAAEPPMPAPSAAPSDAIHVTPPGPAAPPTVSTRLEELCERAQRARASDLHLADGQPVYLRVDGRLERVPGAHESVSDYLALDAAARASIASGRALEYGAELPGGQRLRVSVYKTDAGLAAAIRLIRQAAPSLAELGLPLPLEDLADIPHGLVLLCGATGSGKSTTLAALCRRALEHRSVVLVTLEDPIEFALPKAEQSLARQRQVGRDVPDFTTGLRDALRGDPDVIMVGELRDAETIRLALTAAETGHLVLASLHSGSAAGCIERVLDAYPSEERHAIRAQLANVLRAVVVQRLLPRARGSGRVPALEVLRATHAVSNVIREGKTAQIGTLLQGGSREGMLSLERCLSDLAHAGTITQAVAVSAANDQDSLAMYLAKRA